MMCNAMGVSGVDYNINTTTFCSLAERYDLPDIDETIKGL